MDLYIYTTPPEAAVTLTLDSGQVIVGSGPAIANGRADAHLLILPDDFDPQGGRLEIRCDGYQPRSDRGLVLPANAPASAAAQFLLDDVHLEAAAPEPEPAPEPPPITSNDPWAIISEVYAGGEYDLATHDGCGQFTEDCCTELHERNNAMWGHFKKNPGQNQYNGHAVDAVQCLAGEFEGGWDIIHNSVSHEATPAFNRVGPSDPAIWYYPAA